jgi:hypothetical protein
MAFIQTESWIEGTINYIKNFLRFAKIRINTIFNYEKR